QRNALGQVSDEIEPGTIQRLAPGQTITFPTPPQNEGFEGYTRGQLRAIAKGFGTGYETMTGDYSGFNFSSARMSFLAANRNFARWRNHIVIPHLREPEHRCSVAALILSGGLTEDHALGLRWTWIPPRR